MKMRGGLRDTQAVEQERVTILNGQWYPDSALGIQPHAMRFTNTEQKGNKQIRKTNE